jgi:hypothetical protein
MGRVERRASGRIACRSTVARFAASSVQGEALVADVSLDGIRLVGRELPPPDSIVLLELGAPCHAVAQGRVRWRNRARSAIGIEIPRSSARADFARTLLALAFEIQTARPGAAVLVSDPALAAALCQPLRAHGFVPRWFSAPLDALEFLNGGRPPVRLVVVAPGALGVPRDAALAFLADEYPDVPAIVLPEPRVDANAAGELDALLARAR